MIQIQRTDYDRMLQSMQACLPEEACCLLAGKSWKVLAIYPIENILHSSTRFRMEPHCQLNAFLDMEQRGLDLLAIAHSHPQGPNHPSPTDLQEFHYPGVVSIICQPAGESWSIRAYRIAADRFQEQALYILESS